MFKNGLFFISIGSMLFIYSANAQSGEYHWVNLITSVILMAIGGIMASIGHKRNKKDKEAQNGNH
ncbi:hypothetical protein [Enterococcus casseliflavus]|uniref:hypothetical protein n=1 Tax=Enterococcus casseliflavus TaxID=37734 RepID=UPI0001B6DBB3|nr:hypothetical protein [Enterococcus casseliflavus]EEV30721.1 predicted protein [Enterococcus casseliflavus EC30]EEV37049.1 predicted protein [Enterococcus casseliflavus EC10]